MATYRNVQIVFWDDPLIVEKFTPEDRYFYLYLLTNPHSKLCGCYEVSLSVIARETGYSIETVAHLISRFQNQHGVIRYNKSTKEILILNWWKHNWKGGDRLANKVAAEIKEIRSKEFRKYLLACINNSGTAAPPAPRSPKSEENPPAPQKKPSADEIPYDQIQDLYNSICADLPKLKTLSTARKKAIRSAFSHGKTIQDLAIVFQKAQDNEFLSGRKKSGDRSWRANFDWLMNENNMAKVLDGNYDSFGNTRASASDRALSTLQRLNAQYAKEGFDE